MFTYKEKSIFKAHTSTFFGLLQNRWVSSVALTWYINSHGAWISQEFMKNPIYGKRKRRGDRPKQYTYIFRELILKMW